MISKIKNIKILNNTIRDLGPTQILHKIENEITAEYEEIFKKKLRLKDKDIHFNRHSLFSLVVCAVLM